jgi:hypothetical protein
LNRRKSRIVETIGTAISIFFVVSESATSHSVDDNEEYKENDVDNSNSFPCGLEVVEKTGLAGFAIVAKLMLFVVPKLAI